MFPVYRSKQIHIVLQPQGRAVLTFDVKGNRPQRWDVSVVAEWEQAIEWLDQTASVQVLLIRSASSSDFCSGWDVTVERDLRGPADRAAFAWRVQQLVRRLVATAPVTVAWVEGTCLGIGWELALACDYRVVVQRAATRIGCPEGLLCFGGSVLLRSRHSDLARRCLAAGQLLSAWEAYQLGLADYLCTPSSEPTEQHDCWSWLPVDLRKRPAPQHWLGLGRERRMFAISRSVISAQGCVDSVVDSRPTGEVVLGVWGSTPALERWLAELILVEPRVHLCGRLAGFRRQLAQLQQRGFFAPYELQQLSQRLHEITDPQELTRANWVWVAGSHESLKRLGRLAASLRVVAVQEVGEGPLVEAWENGVARQWLRLCFVDQRRAALFADSYVPQDILAQLRWWFDQMGWSLTVFPPAARLLTQAA